MGKSTAHKYLLFLFLVLNLGAANAQDKGKLEKLIDKAYSIVEGDSAKPKSHYSYVGNCSRNRVKTWRKCWLCF
jgi:hypothetical protein